MDGKTCLENTSFIDLWDQRKSLKTLIYFWKVGGNKTCFFPANGVTMVAMKIND